MAPGLGEQPRLQIFPTNLREKNMTSMMKKLLIPAILTLVLAGCGGVTTRGGQNLGVSGAAAGGSSEGADSSLEHCSAPLGTIAIDDGRNAGWFSAFSSATSVTTVEPLLRLAVQQSNCFVITSIGNQHMDDRLSHITDRQRNSGEYRAGSKQEKGQRVAADYYLEPAIIISDSPIGGLSSSLSGLLGSKKKNTGAIAGSFESKASVVTLSLIDIRSAIQIAAAEGSATSSNYGAALSAFGPSAAGSLKGFSSTPAGKATVEAFMDAWNKMIVALRSYKAQDVEGGMGRGGKLKVN
jgi:hypothetical protein